MDPFSHVRNSCISHQSYSSLLLGKTYWKIRSLGILGSCFLSRSTSNREESGGVIIRFPSTHSDKRKQSLTDRTWWQILKRTDKVISFLDQLVFTKFCHPDISRTGKTPNIKTWCLMIQIWYLYCVNPDFYSKFWILWSLPLWKAADKILNISKEHFFPIIRCVKSTW